ncbi:MAG TPA: hypothetical protein VHX18_04490 [Rhizomicrobium sp.]|jgi:hypothetical protein|nr:hypothetical protein [Rhizomicrobium sp.]
MKFRIAVAMGLVLAAAIAWLAWRLITVPAVVSSDIVEAPTGHAYRFVSAPDSGWNADRVAAARLSWHGRSGYLVTIDDATEYQFVMDRLFPHAYPDVTYLGGRQTAPGEWRWVTGPDGAEDGGKGRLFWRGDEQGAVVGSRYANWMSTAFQHGGKWDVGKVCCVSLFSYGVPQFSTSLGSGDRDEHVAGYIVEFGG